VWAVSTWLGALAARCSRLFSCVLAGTAVAPATLTAGAGRTRVCKRRCCVDRRRCFCQPEFQDVQLDRRCARGLRSEARSGGPGGAIFGVPLLLIGRSRHTRALIPWSAWMSCHIPVLHCKASWRATSCLRYLGFSRGSFEGRCVG